MKETSTSRFAFPVLVVLGFAILSASAQRPVIASFSRNGELVCSNLLPGTVATVEWAPTPNGPWTNNWAGLEAVTVASNGAIRVGVPMFYRVRGVPGAPGDMVWIPPGAFAMGDTFNESFPDERPVHTVQVSGFYMGRYEVTKTLWDEVYEWATQHGYSFFNSFHDDDYGGVWASGTNHPARSMEWYDAVKWCNARSEMEGRVPAYYTSSAHAFVYRSGVIDVQNDWVKWNAGYRLPTEAEWEKAARGGVSGWRFPWGDTISHTQANYYACPGCDGGSGFMTYDVNPTEGDHPDALEGTTPVGSFTANGYGLYDMAGNVEELCWDWWDGAYYGASSTTDPRGPATGSCRVIRGGRFDTSALECRSAHRAAVNPGYDDDDQDGSFGFRVVLGQP